MKSEQSAKGPGRRALALGIVSVAGLCVPIIGEFVAAPMAVAAVVLGYIGLGHPTSARVSAAMAGMVLGALAIAGLVVLLAASRLG